MTVPPGPDPHGTVRRAMLPLSDAAVDAVSGAVHEPPHASGPGVLLLPGAGGDLDARALVALAETLAAAGATVVRANLPHRELGRRFPPRAEAAVDDAWRVAEAARALVGIDDWILGGRSYGGRVLSLAHADGLEALGLLFHAYPLHAPGRVDALRVEHWDRIRRPCLFLQGTHDEFARLDLLRAALPRIDGAVTLEVVEGADHALKVTRRHAPDGEARADTRVVADLAPAVTRWLGESARRPGRAGPEVVS
ncbi:MAG: alpha/beta family hydrolase [Nitriliruptoraceae bacterium]